MERSANRTKMAVSGEERNGPLGEASASPGHNNTGAVDDIFYIEHDRRLGNRLMKPPLIEPSSSEVV